MFLSFQLSYQNIILIFHGIWDQTDSGFNVRSRKSSFPHFRLMVLLAWLLTLIFTWPQAVIFRVLKHPKKEFYQCTTFNFFENLAKNMGNDSFYRK